MCQETGRLVFGARHRLFGTIFGLQSRGQTRGLLMLVVFDVPAVSRDQLAPAVHLLWLLHVACDRTQSSTRYMAAGTLYVRALLDIPFCGRRQSIVISRVIRHETCDPRFRLIKLLPGICVRT